MAEPKKTGKRPLLTINQQTRSDELLTIAVLIALLFLIGLAGLFWSTWNRIALVPTPTPTVTDSPPVTSTPDRPATQIAIQLETQTAEAQALALLLEATQTAIQLQTQEPTLTASALTQEALTASAATAVAQSTLDAQLTATQVATGSVPAGDVNGAQTPSPDATTVSTTTNAVFNPIIPGTGSDDSGQTSPGQGTTSIITPTLVVSPTQPIATEPLPVSTGIYVPVAINSQNPTPTPTLLGQPSPTSTPTNLPVDVPTTIPTESTPTGDTDVSPAADTPTATLTPTPLPTLTPSPIPTRFIQGQLNGVVNVADNQTAKLRSDPRGKEIGDLNHNQQVSLTSRTLTGEWINVCCLDQQVGWLRRTELKLENNVLDEGAPEDVEPNDIRWLRVDGPQSADPLARPLQVMLPPAGTYPLLRGNSANHGRVGELPTAPVISIWEGKQGIASAQIVSPITLSASGVFVNTQDGRLYSFSKDTGDERWRVSFEAENVVTVSRAPIVNGTQLYAVSDSGFVYRFEDATSEAATWNVRLEVDSTPLIPVTDINITEGCLYMGAKNDTTHYLASIRQSDGRLCFTAKQLDGTSMQYPAIGGQLVFVGTDRGMYARDTSTGDEVWVNTESLDGISAPPVYGFPGIDALSELYVARQTGEIVALNANTGARIWSLGVGPTVTGMALDDEYLYVTGNGFIKIISRADRGVVADIGVTGNVPNGPLVSATSIMVVTDFGNITFIERGSWRVIDSRVVDGSTATSFAANGPILYIHDNSTSIRGFRTQQQ